jgi:hypothetical protein
VAIASDGVVNIAWAKQNSVKFARELKDKKDSLAHLIYPGKWWTTVMYTKEIPVIPTSPPGR